MQRISVFAIAAAIFLGAGCVNQLPESSLLTSRTSAPSADTPTTSIPNEIKSSPESRCQDIGLSFFDDYRSKNEVKGTFDNFPKPTFHYNGKLNKCLGWIDEQWLPDDTHALSMMKIVDAMSGEILLESDRETTVKNGKIDNNNTRIAKNVKRNEFLRRAAILMSE